MSEYTGGEGLHRIVKREAGKAPVTRISVHPAGPLAIVRVFTCKPDTFQSRRTPQMVSELERVIKKSVTVEVTAEARALAKFVRISPTKAQRVMDTIRGKYVDQAMAILKFTPNRAARVIERVLNSAAANASEGWGAQPDELKISLITAGCGPTMKRIQPRAMGRAYRILKRSSHVEISVQQADPRLRKKVAHRARKAEVRRVGRKG